MSVDISNIPIDRLERLEKEIETEKLRDKERNLIATDDSYFETYFEQDKLGKGYIAPIVRQHTYKGEPIYTSQFINGHYFGYDEDNRPVVMKGSKHCMQNRYKTKSAISCEIVDRYFRFIKYSCFCPDKHHKKRMWLRKRLTENGWYIGNDRYEGKYPSKNNGLYFLGEWIWKDDERYLEIIEKLDSKSANKLKREIREEEARKKWLKKQDEKYERRTQREKEAEEKRQLNIQKQRERKAQQIAAYEILMEVKDAHTVA